MKFLPKNIKKEQLIVALLFGILLLIIALPTKKNDDPENDSFLGTTKKETEQTGAQYDELEEKLADSLSNVEGIGQVRVVLTYANKDEKILPNVQGVLVIAQGGDNPIVINNIQEAVVALFQVEAHKIKVMKMK